MLRNLLLVILLLMIYCSSAVAAVEISSPGKQQIPLALTQFMSMDGGADPAMINEFSAVLAADLELSGLFALIDPRAFLADSRKLGLLSIDVDFAEWRLLGAESLIKGGYSIRGDQLVLEARLYDVVSRRLLNGRRYVGKLTDVRRIAHAFADQILKSLTGELGPFSTRIAYISDRTGHKELYVAEVDGHQPIRLTNHQRIVLNPDFSQTA